MWESTTGSGVKWLGRRQGPFGLYAFEDSGRRAHVRRAGGVHLCALRGAGARGPNARPLGTWPKQTSNNSTHHPFSRATFVGRRRMWLRERVDLAPDVEAEANAGVAGARRVVVTTLAHHRTRVLRTASGCKRHSCHADAGVRAAPLIFMELGTVVRAAPRVGATRHRPPDRGGARAGVG